MSVFIVALGRIWNFILVRPFLFVKNVNSLAHANIFHYLCGTERTKITKLKKLIITDEKFYNEKVKQFMSVIHPNIMTSFGYKYSRFAVVSKDNKVEPFSIEVERVKDDVTNEKHYIACMKSFNLNGNEPKKEYYDTFFCNSLEDVAFEAAKKAVGTFGNNEHIYHINDVFSDFLAGE